MAAEAGVNALNRRVQGLEEDLEKTEEKLLTANQKLDKAATAADDSERMKKVLQNKAEEDEKRMAKLEDELKDARNQAEEADRKYEEVAEEKANQREQSYKEQIKTLTARLKQAEARA